MPRPRSPVRLRHTTVPSRRTAFAAMMAAAVLLSIAAAVGVVALRLLAEALTASPVNFWDEVVPTLGIAAFVLVFAYAVSVPGRLLLEFLRTARWLDGTSLGQRRLIRTVWVDLATARVGIGWSRGSTRYRLIAVSETGAEVTLPLWERSGALPADQLAAVAHAVTARSRAGDPAVAVAEQLHRVATVPDGAVPDGNVPLPAEAAADGVPPAAPRAPDHSDPVNPVILLGLAGLLLLMAVSGAMWASDEAHRWLAFRQADECRASSPSGTGPCRTDPATIVTDVSRCYTRYCYPKTRYFLQLSDGERAEAAFDHRVTGPVEGDRVEVRVFDDSIVALHDGSAWVDTRDNPRRALPFKFTFASALLGAGLGALIGAVAIGGVRGGGWRRRHRGRRPRHSWGWVGVVFALTPVPAFFVAAFFGAPPIWVPPVVQAATAGTTVGYLRRRRRRAGDLPARRPGDRRR